MKKLKIKSLYKYLILLIINILIKNNYILLFSVALIFFIEGKKSILLSVILISIVFVSNNHADLLKCGFVDSVNDKYIIINKILYKTKIYTTEYEVGDIVLTKDSNNNENESDLKNNIIFYNEQCKLIATNKLKNKLYKYIESLEYCNIYKNIFYNIYDEDIYQEFDSISFSLSFYYLAYLIFRNNKKAGILLISAYSLLFGFQIKFYLIIINFILSYFEFDRTENTLLKILIICIINKYLLLNYSFVLGIIISLYGLTNKIINPLFIGILQSHFFGEIKIFNVMFYKLYIFEKISISILALLSLLIHPLQNILIIYSHILDNILSIFSFSIREKINIFSLIFLILLIKLLKIKNNYLKYILFLIFCIIPFNMFTTHINFIDVGQGDSALIVDSSSHKTILIDTGSKYNYSKLRKELFKEGIYKIDYLIISHDDEDHNGNINNLYKDFVIGNIIYEGKDISTEKMILKYLPLPKSENDNDNSLVYMLYLDNYSILFTGDISKNIENNIITEHSINDIDILKVSHHGSNSATSKYFVGSLKPEVAIISTSGLYGHPHKDVINTLDDFLVRKYITKDDGSIKIFFTNFIDFIITDNNRFDIIKK